jgi:hypothetical protein
MGLRWLGCLATAKAVSLDVLISRFSSDDTKSHQFGAILGRLAAPALGDCFVFPPFRTSRRPERQICRGLPYPAFCRRFNGNIGRMGAKQPRTSCYSVEYPFPTHLHSHRIRPCFRSNLASRTSPPGCALGTGPRAHRRLRSFVQGGKSHSRMTRSTAARAPLCYAFVFFCP